MSFLSPGRHCDVDIDECAITPKICNHGVCVNVPGSYECYCRPGYTGDSCEQDIDECLSSPCKNGGSCQNLENNYECTCMEGFEGKDCSININECEASPCAEGSTCVDGIASYRCVCQDGLTGPNCEIDIDDCESAPCQHGGRCVDGLNSYSCACGGTGYAGDDCELNIDECAPQPCRHGGTCVDDVNDYHCNCYPAYTGKNCESDINECESEPCKYGGVCLERSNASLYQAPGAPRLQVGPQPQMLLPTAFYQPFSLDTAAGFECVCVLGTTGSRCELNIDECASSPCENGKCIDGIGGYTCDCAAGFEGEHCEVEIDECQSTSAATRATAPPASRASTARSRSTSARAHRRLHVRLRRRLRGRALRGRDRRVPEVSVHVSLTAHRRLHVRLRRRLRGRALRGRDRRVPEVSVHVSLTAHRRLHVRLRRRLRGRALRGRDRRVPEVSVHVSLTAHRRLHVRLRRRLRGRALRGRDRRVPEVSVHVSLTAHRRLHVRLRRRLRGRALRGRDRRVPEVSVHVSLTAHRRLHVRLRRRLRGRALRGRDRRVPEVSVHVSLTAHRRLHVRLRRRLRGRALRGRDRRVPEVSVHVSLTAHRRLHVRLRRRLRGRALRGRDRRVPEVSVHVSLTAHRRLHVRLRRRLRGRALRGRDRRVPEVSVHVSLTAHRRLHVRLRRRLRGRALRGRDRRVPEVSVHVSLTAHRRLHVRLRRRLRGRALRGRDRRVPEVSVHVSLTAHRRLHVRLRRRLRGRALRGRDRRVPEVSVHVSLTAHRRLHVRLRRRLRGRALRGRDRRVPEHIGGYTCDCAAGFEGEHCEVEIDECQRYSPCAHGKCFDGRATYYCLCTKGWGGQNCSVVLQGCRDAPCRNNGTCHPWLRHETEHRFNCSCTPGHYGTTCEKVYIICTTACARTELLRGAAGLPRRAVPQQRHVPPLAAPRDRAPLQLLLHARTLRHHLREGIHHMYYCLCTNRTAPWCCRAAATRRAATTARATPGCATRPSTASTAPARPDTTAPPARRYTSYVLLPVHEQNCSVVLQGCRDAPCRNNGTCHPWLRHETEHRFNCSCTPGHYGTTCEKITTMSLEKSSYAEVNTTREEGYDISFRFKTTLGNGLLAMGRGLTYFFLELSNGRLNLHSSLLNKWEGVFIGSNLNDSKWQKVSFTCTLYLLFELSNGRLNLHSSLLNKWEGVFIGSNLNDSKWQKVSFTCTLYLLFELSNGRLNLHSSLLNKWEGVFIGSNLNDSKWQKVSFTCTLYLLFELSNGRLNLHSSLLNKWEGVFIGSNLNDSKWQKVSFTCTLYLLFELSNGRLNLHSSLLNKWEGVFIGSNLNDSKWQKVSFTCTLYLLFELYNGRLNLHSSLLNKWEGVFIGSNLNDSKWQKVSFTCTLYLLFELYNGRLNLHSSLLNKWEGVFIGSNLNDSKWQKVSFTCTLYLLFELYNGRLNLHSSLLNKWEGVFIGSNLNDSKWQKVSFTCTLYLLFELYNGRLNLHSSLLNKWEGVFIGSNLNDSKWQKVSFTCTLYLLFELYNGRLNLHSSLLNKWEGVFIGSNLNDSKWQKVSFTCTLYLLFELYNGRLNLHSSLLNKWEGVFIGSNLNDSKWQKVFVTINSSHLVLAANEEQTIYPISQNEAYNSSVTSFPSTRLGTYGSSYATLTHGPNFFVGCFQDVVVNGQWVLPEDSSAGAMTTTEAGVEEAGAGGADAGPLARAELHGVLAQCPRTPQCAPNPCRSGGACEDAWTSFVCTCPRPHLGDTCQYMPAHAAVRAQPLPLGRRLRGRLDQLRVHVPAPAPRRHLPVQYVHISADSLYSLYLLVEGPLARAELHGVLAQCPRTPQCAPNPCRSGGACEDAWTSFVCTCPRPHLGDTCQYMPAHAAVRAQPLPLGRRLRGRLDQLRVHVPAPAPRRHLPVQYVHISADSLYSLYLLVEGPLARAELHGVLAQCPRTPQCAPNPCRSGGACEDAWTSFVCTCPRPHLGDTCQYMPAHAAVRAQPLPLGRRLRGRLDQLRVHVPAPAPRRHLPVQYVHISADSLYSLYLLVEGPLARAELHGVLAQCPRTPQCAPNPCRSGGACEDAWTSFVCTCPRPHLGDTCQYMPAHAAVRAQPLPLGRRLRGRLDQLRVHVPAPAPRRHLPVQYVHISADSLYSLYLLVEGPLARAELHGVLAQCPRTPQCAPNPCRSGGACEDAWTSFVCTCPRPHLGDTCQYMPAHAAVRAQPLPLGRRLRGRLDQLRVHVPAPAPRRHLPVQYVHISADSLYSLYLLVEGPLARAELHGVLAQCPRTPQCAPNPCRSGGACEDAWTSFVCTCPRPHLGDTCQYMPAHAAVRAQPLPLGRRLRGRLDQLRVHVPAPAPRRHLPVQYVHISADSLYSLYLLVEGPLARAELHGVLAQCPRTPQCAPNPCRSGGACEDAWTSFVCTCPRPHLGDTCQYMPAHAAVRAQPLPLGRRLRGRLDQLRVHVPAPAPRRHLPVQYVHISADSLYSLYLLVEGPLARAELHGVLAQCPRTPQCAPNPCRSGGACEDAWTSFVCTCPRPHLGDTCQYMPAHAAVRAQPLPLGRRLRGRLDQLRVHVPAPAPRRHLPVQYVHISADSLYSLYLLVEGPLARAELHGVLAQCPRTPQCAPNPCRSGGACEDAWTSFVCTCPRPHLGDTCQYMPAHAAVRAQPLPLGRRLRGRLDQLRVHVPAPAPRRHLPVQYVHISADSLYSLYLLVEGPLARAELHGVLAQCPRTPQCAPNPCRSGGACEDAWTSFVCTCPRPHLGDTCQYMPAHAAVRAQPLPLGRRLRGRLDQLRVHVPAPAPRRHLPVQYVHISADSLYSLYLLVEGPLARAELHGVLAQCPRTPQCAPNPCRSGGACEDAWTSFVCTCPRPHLGDTCQYMPAHAAVRAQPLPLGRRLRGRLDQLRVHVPAPAPRRHLPVQYVHISADSLYSLYLLVEGPLARAELHGVLAQCPRTPQCAPNPCRSGGACEDAWTSFVCTCPRPHLGDTCQYMPAHAAVRAQPLPLGRRLRGRLDQLRVHVPAPAPRRHLPVQYVHISADSLYSLYLLVEGPLARAELHGVLAQCPRTPQCAPNPCRSGGACEDAWTSFVCTCPRPHLGDTCQYMPAHAAVRAQPLPLGRRLRGRLDQLRVHVPAPAPRRHLPVQYVHISADSLYSLYLLVEGPLARAELHGVLAQCPRTPQCAPNPCRSGGACEDAWTSFVCTCPRPHLGDTCQYMPAHAAVRAQPLPLGRRLRGRLDQLRVHVPAPAPRRHLPVQYVHISADSLYSLYLLVEGPLARAELHGVLAQCPRTPQCAPNPCRSGGACEDAWTSFVCTCPRPHLGDTCQYMPAHAAVRAQPLPLGRRLRGRLDQLRVHVPAPAPRRHLPVQYVHISADSLYSLYLLVEGPLARAELHGVLAQCPRTPQCAPNPCRSGGACEDAWTSFVCTCPRPHLGDTCQYMPAHAAVRAQPLPLGRRLRGRLDQLRVHVPAPAPRRHLPVQYVHISADSLYSLYLLVEGPLARAELHGVLAQCPRTPQCAPNPCRSGGACEDAWTSFVCTCPRPHLGDTCQYMPAHAAVRAQPLPLGRRLRGRLDQLRVHVPAPAPRRHLPVQYVHISADSLYSLYLLVEGPLARAELHGVLAQCPRTPQCAPNPCRSGGACEDAWTSFVCTCPRPHLGDTCQYMPAHAAVRAQPLPLGRRLRGRLDQLRVHVPAPAPRRHLPVQYVHISADSLYSLYLLVEGPLARAELHGVLAQCPRTPQCAPNPCRSGGACEDAWTSFVCTCPRPHLGDTCQYMPAHAAVRAQPLPLGRRLRGRLDQLRVHVPAPAPRRHLPVQYVHISADSLYSLYLLVEGPLARAELHGVLAQCPRTPQCAPNPCRSGGACEDAWTSFVCTCPRPHLGDTCQYMPAHAAVRAQPLPLGRRLRGRLDQLRVHVPAPAPRRHLPVQYVHISADSLYSLYLLVEGPLARAELHGVLAQCPRTPQCAPNPCRSGGACEDAWTSFVCTCPRPHLGDTCQYMPAHAAVRAQPLPLGRRLRGRLDQLRVHVPAPAPRRHLPVQYVHISADSLYSLYLLVEGPLARAELHGVLAQCPRTPQCAPNPCRSGGACEDAWTSFVCTCPRPHLGDTCQYMPAHAAVRAQPLPLGRRLRGRLDQLRVHVPAPAPRRHLPVQYVHISADSLYSLYLLVEGPLARAELHGVLAQCPRTPQCAPNPCRSGGACEDAWTSFVCTCPRPHLGDTCQYMPAHAAVRAQPLPLGRRLRGRLDQLRVHVPAPAPRRHLPVQYVHISADSLYSLYLLVEGPLARAELHGVLAQCPRTPQCAPNPCRSGGACEDAWTSFVCTCPRPHLGDTCQYMPAHAAVRAQPLPLGRRLRGRLDQLRVHVPAPAPRRHLPVQYVHISADSLYSLYLLVEGPLARAELHGVLAQCPRTPQCAPNPCRSGGACEDAWTSFVCTCPRPHLGDTCQYMPAHAAVRAQPLPLGRRLRGRLDQLRVHVPAPAPRRHLPVQYVHISADSLYSLYLLVEGPLARAELHGVLAQCPRTPQCAPNPCRSGGACEDAWTSFVCTCPRPHLGDTCQYMPAHAAVRAQPLPLGRRLRGRLDQLRVHVPAPALRRHLPVQYVHISADSLYSLYLLVEGPLARAELHGVLAQCPRTPQCAPNPCRSGGACEDAWTSFVCTCPRPHLGDTCQYMPAHAAVRAQPLPLGRRLRGRLDQLRVHVPAPAPRRHLPVQYVHISADSLYSLYLLVEGPLARAELHGVLAQCPRTPQCAPNPCRSGGACEDAWTSFVCTCPRPHLGDTCQYMPAHAAVRAQPLPLGRRLRGRLDQLRVHVPAPAPRRHLPVQYVHISADSLYSLYLLVEGPLARAELHGVLAQCPRTPQCAPNPCRSGGACEDAWTSFVCTCPRPHLGDTCQYMPAHAAVRAQPLPLGRRLRGRLDQLRVHVPAPAPRRHLPVQYVHISADSLYSLYLLVEGPLARAELHGVLAQCPRTPQCAPNPCRSGGACEDAWTSFVCTCPRPHLGDTCQYMPAHAAVRAQPLPLGRRLRGRLDQLRVHVPAPAPRRHLPVQYVHISADSLYSLYLLVEGPLARAELHGVLAQCPRTPQCAPNPCRSGGACEDAWTSFVCTCPRPHLGDTCQYSTYTSLLTRYTLYTSSWRDRWRAPSCTACWRSARARRSARPTPAARAAPARTPGPASCARARARTSATPASTVHYTAATFGQESALPRSVVRVAVSDAARRGVRAALDISMFIRTRKPTGQIFYLGSLPRFGQTDETQVGASLEGGELLVHLRFNQTPENYTVGGTRLDNGYLHLIEVVRNSTLVQVKLNGTEYFRKSISAAKMIDAQVLYLGGPPPPPVPGTTELPPAAAAGAALPTTPAPPAPSAQPEPDDSAYFKGVIQDVQISNGVNVTIVEFFPLQVAGLALPPPFGDVRLDAGVLRGVVSDDLCAERPCLHNATCTNTWNDYTCQCPRGYKGKTCSEVEFCQLQGCPHNSQCRNLDAGYECVSNATFDGINTTLTYKLRVPRTVSIATDEDLDLPETLTITYRSKTGGTLFHAESVEGNGSTGAGGAWFTVGVFKEQVAVQWRLGTAALPALRRMRAHSHLHWTTLRFTFSNNQLRGAFIEPNGHEETGLTASVDTRAWQQLVMEGRIHLGGIGHNVPTTTTPAMLTTMVSTLVAVAPRASGDSVTRARGTLLMEGRIHLGGIGHNVPTTTTPAMLTTMVSTLVAVAPRASGDSVTRARGTLLMEGRIHLGGIGHNVPTTTTPAMLTTMSESSTDPNVWEYSEGEEVTGDNLAGEYFKGCMGAVHVGGLLLPFFTEEDLFVGATAALLAAQPHYALLSGRPYGADVGCLLCLERDCASGGHCADVRSSYACACPPGYAGDYCQVCRHISRDATGRGVRTARTWAACCAWSATARRAATAPTCARPTPAPARRATPGTTARYVVTSAETPQVGASVRRGRGLPAVPGARLRVGRPLRRRALVLRLRLPAGLRRGLLPGMSSHQQRRHRSGRPYGADVGCLLCLERDCASGGHCADVRSSYACACPPGYAGDYCQRRHRSGRPYGADVGCLLCLERDCASGGHCADVRSSYACACPPGYAGDYCQIDVDECAAHQCQNGATCKDGIAAYTCICPVGFDGDFCEHDIDECQSGPCLHGGACTDLAGAFSCACAPQWRGPTCAAPRDRSCAHQPCGPAALACKDVEPDPPTGNNFTCVCNEGFEGVYCERAFCDVQPCVHGKCVNDSKTAERDNFTCVCNERFEGVYCERAFCDVQPCVHGKCVNDSKTAERDNFTCVCNERFEGVYCERAFCDVQPCVHGKCVNDSKTAERDNFTCVCNERFEGVYCERAFCDVQPCVHGKCVNDSKVRPPALCEYIINKLTCLNIQNRMTPSSYSGRVVTSKQLFIKTAVCLCANGYSGRYCETERDECAEAGGAAACLHGGRCLDATGAYLCDCEGTGVTICDDNVEEMMLRLLVIVLLGWTGARCEVDVDECEAGLVSCGPGDCQNLNGSYICLCAAGYCGHECSLLDPCYQPGAGNATGPCQHGGVCEQRCAAHTDYVCHCVDGWGGHNCSQQVVSSGSAGAGDTSSTVLIGVGAALVGLALAGAALGALGAQARRKRATRGTYSPSGQEYCNPRAEMMQHALKPPPEERLI
ncbi:hypothetical protein PYW07_014946 [Mythimna separata]|uniref:Protein crumbs n=1 Tax=Mythimna separata TaxID=271217 RepID=A0AAD8DZG2_MYTSE|nr:hypothetical protein PYW07_014946 [Mythimna separata]